MFDTGFDILRFLWFRLWAFLFIRFSLLRFLLFWFRWCFVTLFPIGYWFVVFLLLALFLSVFCFELAGFLWSLGVRGSVVFALPAVFLSVCGVGFFAGLRSESKKLHVCGRANVEKINSRYEQFLKDMGERS
jgi:hypothetical protein